MSHPIAGSGPTRPGNPRPGGPPAPPPPSPSHGGHLPPARRDPETGAAVGAVSVIATPGGPGFTLPAIPAAPSFASRRDQRPRCVGKNVNDFVPARCGDTDLHGLHRY